MGLLNRKRMVAVIGASSADEGTVGTAAELGSLIARAGWNLICGGGGGIMEGACRGFVEERERAEIDGIVAIGILPGEDPAWGNDYLDVAIPTGIGWARNAIITRSADAVISVAGCSGTLSELAYAWQMNKPIVALAKTGGWSARMAGERIDERRADPVGAAKSPAEAVSLIAAAMEERGHGR